MAGEWLMVDIGIGTKPEVLELNELTGEPVGEIVLRLIQLWGWFSINSADGKAAMTPRRLASVCGGDESFWLAVESVGWIKFGKKTAEITKWEDRFSKAAKARAQGNRRVAKHRNGKKPEKNGGCNGGVTVERYECNGDALQGGNGDALQGGNGGAYTRGEEKRGEEKEPAAPVATSVSRSRPPSPKISWNPSEGWSGITAKDRAGWAEAYPAVNLDRALAAMSEWLKANPTKAKKTLWRAFAVRWLAKEQDRGGDAQSNRPGATVTPKENRRYFRSDAHKSLTDAEYEAWKAEQGSQRQITQGKANSRQNASQGPTGAGGQTSRVSEFGRKLATDLVEEF